MASLETRNGWYRIIFYVGRKEYRRSLQTQDPKQAEIRKKAIESRIQLIDQGLLDVPDGVDLPVFIMSEGKRSELFRAPERQTLRQVIDRYLRAHPEGSLEPTTLYTIGVHTRHVLRILGERFVAGSVTMEDLQGYVNKRLKEKGQRGKTISPTTIRKEIKTLSAIWTWAQAAGLAGPFPNTRLNYGKTEEKPPFMTWEEINRRIERGVPKERQTELWDCLYLDIDQIDELLEHVKAAANQPFIYPMFATAAHTGARRSELLRSEIPDIDFEQNIITIQERKRVKGKFSTRRVPMSSFLSDVLRKWVNDHPGGNHTFAQELSVVRSKKSRTTYGPVTRDEANDHFQRTVKGSKWAVMRGWHTLRHSFISNCVSKGVSMEFVMKWVGHLDPQTTRRYLHLLPSSQQEALKSVFR